MRTRIALICLIALTAFSHSLFSADAPAATVKPEWKWEKTPAPLGLVADGVWYESFHVDTALDKAGVRQRSDFKNLSQYSVIVLVNTSVYRLPKGAVDEIREFVNQGGGLVVLGGLGAYDNGAYTGTPLEEILPVALKESYIDFYPTAEKGAKLTKAATADWPLKYDFQAGPSAYYFHTLTPKPGAKVQLKIGELPALVTGTFGKGRVVACALTVNGNPPAGALPFWEWKDWPALLGQAVEWAAAVRPAGVVVEHKPEAPSPPVKAVTDKKADLDAIDALGMAGNKEAIPGLKTRFEEAMKPARLPDGPDRWDPYLFADATPVAAHAAMALYRLGEPDAVGRLCELFRNLNFYDQICWNNSYRSTPCRLHAQLMDVIWEYLENNIAPIPASQGDAFVKYAATAEDPVIVEFLSVAMEKSAAQKPGADWKKLAIAKSGIIVKMGQALSQAK